MPRQIITSTNAPTSPLFSQGVKAGPYARWFPSEPPARYVAKLGVDVPGLLVSIRMTAFLDATAG